MADLGLGTAVDIGSKVVGLGIGIAQKAKAKKLSAEADQLTPALEDPRQVALLDAVKRKAYSISTGSDPLAAEMSKDISQNLATTQDTLAQNVGGDSSALLTGLRKTQGDANAAEGKVGAVLAKGAENYTGLVSSMTDAIASRTLDIQMSQKMQKLREAAEMAKSANENISGSLGGFGGFDYSSDSNNSGKNKKKKEEDTSNS